MSLTLATIQAKIVETESAISKVKTAQGYGKGDKNVQRAQLEVLNDDLYTLRRSERELTAAQGGAVSPGVITASYNRSV